MVCTGLDWLDIDTELFDSGESGHWIALREGWFPISKVLNGISSDLLCDNRIPVKGLKVYGQSASARIQRMLCTDQSDAMHIVYVGCIRQWCKLAIWYVLLLSQHLHISSYYPMTDPTKAC